MNYVKTVLACVVAVVIFELPGNAQVSLNQLNRIANKLLAHSPHKPHTQIFIDRQRASGRAAVMGSRMQALIFVDPEQMAKRSENTWAFWLGHEFGHPLIPWSGGTPQAEQACDEFGAKLAIKAGYKLQKHLNEMRNDSSYQVCSPTHGCEANRLQNLANKFSASVEIEGEHENCPVRGSLAKGSCGKNTIGTDCSHSGRCSLPGVTTPCPHVTACNHRASCFEMGCPPAPCQHPMPCRHLQQCFHRVGCTHGPVQCRHPIQTPWGVRPMHPQGDAVHQFDLAHPGGCNPMHSADPQHPEGDNPHSDGHPRHQGGHAAHGAHPVGSPFCLR